MVGLSALDRLVRKRTFAGTATGRQADRLNGQIAPRASESNCRVCVAGRGSALSHSRPPRGFVWRSGDDSFCSPPPSFAAAAPPEGNVQYTLFQNFGWPKTQDRRAIRQLWPSHYVLEKLEAPGRFELPTRGLGNRCSIHLSYGATAARRMLA